MYSNKDSIANSQIYSKIISDKENRSILSSIAEQSLTDEVDYGEAQSKWVADVTQAIGFWQVFEPWPAGAEGRRRHSLAVPDLGDVLSRIKISRSPLYFGRGEIAEPVWFLYTFPTFCAGSAAKSRCRGGGQSPRGQ